MTVTVIEALLGALLIYCALWCRALVPAIGGQDRPGTHCTGSGIVGLIALGVGVMSWLFEAIFGAGLAAALGGLIGRAGRGQTRPTPSPSPSPSPSPLPSPSPSPSPSPLPPISPSPSPVPAPGGGEGVGGVGAISLVY